MKTQFSPESLADPDMRSSESAIRKCVHCGFCTATCPTYVLLGDELDSPRGRIYLIKEMLEKDQNPTADVVKHIDRCLSCLSCITTCPSDVNYMHLVDHARAYIADRYQRPLKDRFIRWMLARLLPYPHRFRMALHLARLAKPLAPLLAKAGLRPVAAMLRLAPTTSPPQPSKQNGEVSYPNGRVLLLRGCAEPVLRPEFQSAAVRLLNRLGYEVIFAQGEGCCGALVHHMGRKQDALMSARNNVDVWSREVARGDIAAIIVTTSGCGTTIKDYGFMLRDDPAYVDRAARISALAKDVSEFVERVGLPAHERRGLTVAYHAACSLQHGQKVTSAPATLLTNAGYVVRTPTESHLCCGSAGVYNILQPEIADQLGDRKVAAIEQLRPDVIATGNIGCAMQIGQRTNIPVVHTIELLDWATGGPLPSTLRHLQHKMPA